MNTDEKGALVVMKYALSLNKQAARSKICLCQVMINKIIPNLNLKVTTEGL